MFASGAEPVAIYLAVHSVATLASLSIAAESIAVTASSWWMPSNGSLHGIELDHLLRLNLLLILGLFLLAHFLLVLPQLKRKGAHAQPRRLLAIEIASLVVIAGVFVWMTLSSQILRANDRFTGAAPEAMQAEVVGKQFQWYFRYPGNDATFGRVKPELVDAPGGNPLGLDPADSEGNDDIVSSELVLPAGREVDLRLRAQDVIHGFFIPGMRIKQDAIPGMVLHIHFTPVREGEYPILCSQLCGLGHERMQARLRVVSRREFIDWLNERETVRLAQGGSR